MSHQQEQTCWGQWLDRATAGVRFGRDRQAVAAELEAHLEDKAEDLQRIFPDLTAQEAQEKALEQMGDAAEIGRELARIHRPWLGYLWKCSRVLRNLMYLVLIWAALFNTLNYRGYPFSDGMAPLGGRPQSVEPERVRLGGYTFEIVEAVCYDVPNVQDSQLRVAVRITSPRFWEGIHWAAFSGGVTVGNRDGVALPLGEWTSTHGGRMYHGLAGNRQAVFSRDALIFLDQGVWRDGDWVQVNMAFEVGTVSLWAQVEQVEGENGN